MTRWWAGDPERHRLATSIKNLAPGAAVIRVRPDGSVSCYRVDRTVINGRNPGHNRRIAELLRGYFGAVDWSVGHDFHVAAGRLCTAPLQGQPGHWPLIDGTFGSAPGPTYLPTTRTGVRIEDVL